MGFIKQGYSLVIGGIIAPTIGYIISEIIIAVSFSKRIVGKEFKVLPKDLKKIILLE